MAESFLLLRVEYLQGARLRVGQLPALAAAAGESPEARSELRRVAHNLRGSGGFFGFPAISVAAEAVEELARGLQDGESVEPKTLEQAAAELVRVVQESRMP